MPVWWVAPSDGWAVSASNEPIPVSTADRMRVIREQVEGIQRDTGFFTSMITLEWDKNTIKEINLRSGCALVIKDQQ